GKIIRDQAPGNRSSLLKLLLGRIDCYLNDRLSILWEIERIKAEGLYASDSQAIREVMSLKQEAAYLALTNRDLGQYPYKSDFLKKFNAQLNDMKRSGEMRAIIENVLSK
ncbi:MAG: hypothetical protein KGM99_07670, partial [Burkholderiales bacterium]|nr:hypothetical protein [Burkholderiales bacterium]